MSDKQVQQSLYEKRQTIHPRQVSGLFAKLRVVAVFVLLGLYYFLPWLNWDGRQAILFDLPARQFYLFGLTFWPHDFFYLAGLLIIAALALFFFTALAGRLWCGFACPQTVWTEVFMWIERVIEGNRNKRIKLDNGPNNGRKIRLKATKHAIWIIFSLWTGFTFVGYFTPILVLAEEVINFNLGPWEAFWLFFYALATYGNAGWMREQVCIYMCPYARFQSVMLDKHSLIISYNKQRGEPRGHRRHGEDFAQKSLGSCIDCTLCVQVCPTGIDIRDGLQYQCIGCAACVDVCDQVMEKMDYPKGLISYTTEHAQETGKKQFWRPRIIIYGIVLLTLTGVFTERLLHRDLIELEVLRDRNVLYRVNDNGQVENVYTVKIVNKQDAEQRFELRVDNNANLQIANNETIAVDAQAVKTLIITVRGNPASLSANSTSFDLVISDAQQRIKTTQTARFLKP